MKRCVQWRGSAPYGNVTLNRAPAGGGVLEGTFEGTAVSYESDEQWVVVGGRFQVELPE